MIQVGDFWCICECNSFLYGSHLIWPPFLMGLSIPQFLQFQRFHENLEMGFDRKEICNLGF